jgi:dihydrofolate reductase
VIGGATLYASLLPNADYLYLTEINQAFPGDTFFPEIDKQQWVELERRAVTDDASVNFSYQFLTLRRIRSNAAYMLDSADESVN